MNLRSIRIGTRLAIGFGLALASAALLLVLALVSQQVSADRQAQAGQRKAADLGTEAALRAALFRSAIAMRNMGLESELTQVYKHQATAEKERKEYLRLLAEMDAAGGDREAHEILIALQAIDAKTAKQFTEVVGLLGAFSTEPAIKLINEKISPLLGESEQQLGRLNALTHANADAAIAAVQADNQRILLAVMVIGALVLFVISGVAWAVTRSIVQPLRSAMQAADEVTQGNLAFQIDSHGADEPAQLIRGFERMRGSLSAMVGEVRQSAGMVALAAQEIAQGNSDLSTRTERQASSLQQTASTMSQLDGTVRQTADNARQASESARSATSVATAGGEVVSLVVDTMRDIQASSARIGDIIGVIDAIAFQTNILALNAAVEAARAGEQGRGFAVVASEVRLLAGRSADAARQIKELIAKSVERVDRGTELVDRAGRTMDDIVAAIRKVSDIATEISAATGEQSSGVSEVGRTVSHMDQATQQNAALVEQSAAAAESLRHQAGRLVDTVARFRLRSGTEAPAA